MVGEIDETTLMARGSTKNMRQSTGRLILLLLGSVTLLTAENGPYVPRPVETGDFGALTSQSPFSRSINLSDALILTGIAMVDQDQVATLLNKETKETFVVSSRLNAQGWKMVELKKTVRKAAKKKAAPKKKKAAPKKAAKRKAAPKKAAKRKASRKRR